MNQNSQFFGAVSNGLKKIQELEGKQPDKVQLISIESALQLTDKNQIREQIQVREKVMEQMVGSIYPSILRDEIGKLLLLLY